MSKWCDACRDHYPTDHYDRDIGEDYKVHGIGPEYGHYGELLEKEALLEAMLDPKTIAKAEGVLRGKRMGPEPVREAVEAVLAVARGTQS